MYNYTERERERERHLELQKRLWIWSDFGSNHFGSSHFGSNHFGYEAPAGQLCIGFEFRSFAFPPPWPRNYSLALVLPSDSQNESVAQRQFDHTWVKRWFVWRTPLTMSPNLWKGMRSGEGSSIYLLACGLKPPFSRGRTLLQSYNVNWTRSNWIRCLHKCGISLEVIERWQKYHHRQRPSSLRQPAAWGSWVGQTWFR